MWLTFALRHWRIVAGCVAALAVAGAVIYQVHAYGQRHYKSGYTAAETHYRGVIVRRDIEDAKAVADMRAEHARRESAYREQLAVIQKGYADAQAEVTRTRVNNARLVQRVRDLIAANSHPADGAGTDPGGAASGPLVTELPAGPTGDLVEFAAACADTREHEAEQLRALIAAVRARQAGS